MAFDPALLELMPDTVTLKHPRTSGPVDVHGRTQFDPFAPDVTVAGCRVEWKSTLVRGPDGRTVTARGLVYLPGPYDVTVGKTVVTLPGGETPVLLSADIVNDDDGPHHTVLAFG